MTDKEPKIEMTDEDALFPRRTVLSIADIKYVDCCWMCYHVEHKHNDCYCSIWYRYVSTFAVCPRFILDKKFNEYKEKDSPSWIETRYPEEPK